MGVTGKVLMVSGAPSSDGASGFPITTRLRNVGPHAVCGLGLYGAAVAWSMLMPWHRAGWEGVTD
jgi:hypothetical protein